MTTARPWARFTLPGVFAPSSTGAPIPGAKLYFFEGSEDGSEGSTTPLDTFTDARLTVPNTNPVIADANGIFPSIFLQDANYRVMWTDADGHEKYTWDPVSTFTQESAESLPTFVINWTVDGNNQVPEVGKTGDLYIPFDCTLTTAVMQADQAGSAIVDVWAAPFVTNTPPNASNSITASAPPTLDTAQSSIDTTLVGWDTAIAAGTAIRFSLVDVDTLTRFTLSLVFEIPVTT